MKRTCELLNSIVAEYLAFKKFSRLSEAEKGKSEIPDAFATRLLRMGPTLIKFGQILSTRPDMLPSQYVSALQKLQAHVPPFGSAVVRQIIENELGQPISEIFSEFDAEPIASASLSQVHRATLASGETVAVKVQRPGLRPMVSADLTAIKRLLKLLRYLDRKLFVNLNIDSVFEEFSRYTLRELDFEHEGRTYERFRRNFKSTPEIVFPKIYWKFTTAKVLTMEKLSGLRLNAVKANIPSEKRKELATAIVNALINMFVRDGFFHADLHPGNIFFRVDGSIVMLDVGMYGELTEAQRERFVLYWLHIVFKEKREAFDHLLRLTTRRKKADEGGFYRQYSGLLDQFYNSSIQEKSLTQTFLEILIAGAACGFVFPSEMLTLAKALTTAEYIGHVLVPGFNFVGMTKQVVTQSFASRITSKNFVERIADSFPEWFLMGEPAMPRSLGVKPGTDYLLQTIGKRLSRQWDEIHEGNYEEVVHGQFSIVIEKDLETVFNFVTRLARYPLWHPVYTPESRVIHVSGEYIFITPEALGSVFRLDEIVDGYQLVSNGVVTEFERNKKFKWRAPFSMFPLIELGTCFDFEMEDTNRTILSEYFFFSESPAKHIYVNRKWFSDKALAAHIREELSGVKNLLESGDYDVWDKEYLWGKVNGPIRFACNTPIANATGSGGGERGDNDEVLRLACQRSASAGQVAARNPN